jgi:K+-sensing histidine kinase KdpD
MDKAIHTEVLVKRIEETKNTTPGISGANNGESGKDFQPGGGVLSVLGVVSLTTIAAYILENVDRGLSIPVHSANIVMPYLLGIVWAALKYDRFWAIVSVVLNVMSFAFFYIRPIYIHEPRNFDYVLIMVVFLIVAIMINELAFKARKQAERLHAIEAQIDRERMRNTLLRSVSHDLRSPLSTIMGASSSLLDATGRQVSMAERKELAQSICRESKRLDRQVSNLLEMTSLESGGLVLNKEWYGLEEILGNALTSLEGSLGEKEIEIKIGEEIPLVFVDGVLFEKVFINLIENCLKYSPGGRYRVSISKTDSTVDVEVFNTGNPIVSGEEQLIFDKFYRSKSSGEETDGAGLGLAICRAILNLHDGKIFAKPGLSNGVSMKFSLPILKDIPQMETIEE